MVIWASSQNIAKKGREKHVLVWINESGRVFIPFSRNFFSYIADAGVERSSLAHALRWRAPMQRPADAIADNFILILVPICFTMPLRLGTCS
jgi:hypothetical protein